MTVHFIAPASIRRTLGELLSVVRRAECPKATARAAASRAESSPKTGLLRDRACAGVQTVA